MQILDLGERLRCKSKCHFINEGLHEITSLLPLIKQNCILKR